METNSGQTTNKRFFFSSAWFIEDGSFRDWRKNRTPLFLLGRSLGTNSSLKITLPILEGYKLIPEEDKKELRRYFDVIDYSEQFQIIVRSYPNIDRFYSRYERNCFLRWLSFKEVLGANTTQFWHFDSDVVLHSTLDEIASDTEGKTFVLQGCPAFVSITKMSWFDIYERELAKLENDIKKYSDRAAEEKTDCRRNDKRLGNVSLYRNPIGSDQDLIEYLISSEKLPQDDISKTVSKRFFYVENPLLIGKWARSLFPNETISLKREGGKLFCCNRQIPFVHYQGAFCFYANLYIAISRIHLNRIFKSEQIFNFEFRGTKFIISPYASMCWKVLRRIGLEYPREKIIAIMESGNREKLEEILELVIRNNNFEQK